MNSRLVRRKEFINKRNMAMNDPKLKKKMIDLWFVASIGWKKKDKMKILKAKRQLLGQRTLIKGKKNILWQYIFLHIIVNCFAFEIIVCFCSCRCCNYYWPETKTTKTKYWHLVVIRTWGQFEAAIRARAVFLQPGLYAFAVKLEKKILLKKKTIKFSWQNCDISCN